jgi:4-oxalocrotonate tautomerase family enzyme
VTALITKHESAKDMPVIIVRARKGVLKTKEMKAALIDELSGAFARVVGDDSYKSRATVIIDEVSDENWGRAGKQVSS